MLNDERDTDLLLRLYTDNYDMIYRLVSRILRYYTSSENDAADAVQDVFALAAKKIDVLREHRNPVGWLIKTAQYVCNDYVKAYRRKKGKEQLFETLDLHPDREDVYSKRDMLVSLQQELKPEEYAMLKAYYIDERPTEEICREAGITPNLLRVRLHRIKKHLSGIFILLVIFASIQNI